MSVRNLNKKVWFAASLMAACLQSDTVNAQTTESDEKQVDLQDVVVTGARNSTYLRQLPANVTVIGRDRIEETHQPSLLPLLSEQVPGLFVTSRGVMGYGVSGGAAGGISFRGLSGGAGRMLVLIDGHPQYMGLMGHPIADSYQSFLAERVEVLHGPASVIYGSNAMGGVVNIITRRQVQDGVRTHINAGYGSYNTLQTEATNMVRKGRFSSVISGSYNRTDGHRNDMGFEQYGGYAKVGYAISRTLRAEGDVNITHFNASQPGSVSQPLKDADQRVTRGGASVALRHDNRRAIGALTAFYNWGHHWINDGYSSLPEDKATPLPYRFISDDRMMGLSFYESASLFTGNRLTAGLDYFRTGGKAYNKFVAGDKEGQETALADKSQNEVAGYLSLSQDAGQWLTLNAGIRADHMTHKGTEWIPQAGLVVHLLASMNLKLSAGKGFRYPTIREMYMFPPQNPDLKPESLWNYEVSFSHTLLDGNLSYTLDAFYLKGTNLIMIVPREGAAPLNVNTGIVENSGIEFQTACRLSSHWQVNANYSYLHMVHPVLAAPRHKLYAGTVFSSGRFQVSTGLNYINGLYTQLSTGGQGDNKTENFLLWNVSGTYRLGTNWSLWVRGENLLAQQYEINAGYPMPRATVFAGFNLTF